MSLKLKVDLHLHSSHDLQEIVAGRKNLIPPKELVDMAVEQKFDAIAISHHCVQYKNAELIEYANQKGILLIPGVETYIQRKHVLLINFSTMKHILTYQDLKRYKNDDVLVIAPHPFYGLSVCLGKDLIRNIDCFDAIEYCHYYYKFFNPNRKALKIAQKYNLPIIGNSDTHRPFQLGTTYSYVYTEEKTIPAIIKAVKRGKIEYVSHPISLSQFLHETFWLFEKLPYILNIGLRKLALKTSSPFMMMRYATPRLEQTAVEIGTKHRKLKHKKQLVEKRFS
ncbi:MAG: PHP domain-containing protein [bacterium]|nr:MAG: PHP domain-containing protein [bacterium]